MKSTTASRAQVDPRLVRRQRASVALLLWTGAVAPLAIALLSRYAGGLWARESHPAVLWISYVESGAVIAAGVGIVRVTTAGERGAPPRAIRIGARVVGIAYAAVSVVFVTSWTLAAGLYWPESAAAIEVPPSLAGTILAVSGFYLIHAQLLQLAILASLAGWFFHYYHRTHTARGSWILAGTFLLGLPFAGTNLGSVFGLRTLFVATMVLVLPLGALLLNLGSLLSHVSSAER